MVTRALLVVALVLMSLGMASAPAGAHATPEPVASGHCADHQKSPQAPSTPAKSEIDCAMMCLALPAADGPAPARDPLLERPVLIGKAIPIGGIEPEIGTPPPKA